MAGVGGEAQGAGRIADLGADGIGVTGVDLAVRHRQGDGVGRTATVQRLRGFGHDAGGGVHQADIFDLDRQDMAGRQHDAFAVGGGDVDLGRAGLGARHAGAGGDDEGERGDQRKEAHDGVSCEGIA
ncbi:hypothetical protein D3C80_1351300 [compost metagenome]